MTTLLDVQFGNIGTALRLLVKDQDGAVVDISSASTIEIHLWKPDATTATKTAVFTTDGTDGLMQYVTVASDLDQAGVWKIQGKIILGGSTFFTEIEQFRVKANII